MSNYVLSDNDPLTLLNTGRREQLGSSPNPRYEERIAVPVNEERSIMEPYATIAPPVSILDTLAAQVSLFPTMYTMTRDYFGIPSYIVSPKGIDHLQTEIQRGSILGEEIIHFLDMINLFEAFHYGIKTSTTLELYLQCIISNRRNTDMGEFEQGSRNIFSKSGREINSSDLETILRSMPEIMGMYIFATICDIYDVFQNVE